jgi:hypothetical protein
VPLTSSENTRLNGFLKVAATSGVDAAVKKFGDVVSSREAAALKKLSPAELQSLNAINSKISRLAGAGKGADSAWICGALC